MVTRSVNSPAGDDSNDDWIQGTQIVDCCCVSRVGEDWMVRRLLVMNQNERVHSRSSMWHVPIPQRFQRDYFLPFEAVWYEC